jgi:hypothetical protein
MIDVLDFNPSETATQVFQQQIVLLVASKYMREGNRLEEHKEDRRK